MRLTPREPEIPEGVGFTDDNDIFGYREFADKLANLVQNIDEPLVIALDGPWGSGKSVFVKQWAELIRGRGGHVIQFDAFGNDHHEDAFIALSAEFHAAAEETRGIDEGIKVNFLDKTKKALVAVASLALYAALRAGSGGIVTAEDAAALGKGVKEVANALGDGTMNPIEKAVSERLTTARDERAALDAFRDALSLLAGVLAEAQAQEGESFPLIFIVDELDRCRPPFALSVIERIKHMFSVENVCFILVTHIPQLERVVQGAYGADFNARSYLEKFYQLRVILPDDEETREKRSSYIDYLWNVLELPRTEPVEWMRESIYVLIEAHGLSLRTVERVVTGAILICAAAGRRQFFIAPLVGGLCVMRHTHPELYSKAQRKELTWDEARGFLQPTQGRGEQNERVLDWWKYSTIGGALTEERSLELADAIGQNFYGESGDILPTMLRYLENFALRREPAAEA